MKAAAPYRFHMAKLPKIPVYAPVEGGGCTCGDPGCGSPGKHPMLSWSKASNDPAVVERWLKQKRYKGCNWGVVLKPEYGVVVIDIDRRYGGFETVQRNGWKFPKTVTVNTGDGGKHYYYYAPVTIPKNTELGPGVELKVDATIVTPPSRHKSGGSYVFDEAEGLPPHEPFAELPPWVYEVLEQKQTTYDTARTVIDHAEPIPKRKRNKTLARIAGRLRAAGLNREEIEAALLRINNERCKPPLTVKEVQRIAKSIAKYPPGDVQSQAKKTVIFPEHKKVAPANILPDVDEVEIRQKDYGHALVLYEIFKDCTRWAVHRGRWMLYVLGRWKTLTDEFMAFDAAGCLQLYYEKLRTKASSRAEIKELDDKIKEVHMYNKITNVLNFLKGFQEIIVEAHQWDANPWLLNVENGTIDLKKLTLKDHDPNDLITKLAPVKYDPDAKGPRWMQHIERFLPNPNVRRQVQRDLGRALVGAVLDETLSIWYGVGANGKTTTAKVIQKILGDYACQAAPNLLVQGNYERHPTEIADLHNRRLVFSTEIDQGKKLAEALVKQLTGGDKLKGRYMRQDFFEFERTFSIILITNHKPIITGNDEGIWRRIILIPWEVTIPAEERRPQDEVIEELLEERSAILNWMLAGLADWQKDPNWVAPEVRAASEAYRAEMDVIGKFIEDRCELGPGYTVPKSTLYDAYLLWCQDAGEQPISKKAFTARLRNKGIGETRDTKTRYYVGVRLAS